MTGRHTPSVHDTAPITPDPTVPASTDPIAEPLLTLPQILIELAVPRSTFYRWRLLGDAPRAVRLPNGQLRFRRTDLDAWIRDHLEHVPENHP
ncbi:helix-turn-helix transcriptional regulator [Cryptosporangium sp. NPDC051539]|uniref:helix-turn-helix transcriptional regulator n=1 Tax=Cryptosporangium sp. NPDC051539 TaxID=3363962 RepID=UPI0037A9D720